MFETQITDGIDFLDDYFGGRTWIDRIDLDSLQMSNSRACVIAQLFDNNYGQGIKFTGIGDDIDRQYDLGFDARYSHGALTDEWKDAITGMRAESVFDSAPVVDVSTSDFATINGVSFTKDEFFSLMTDLVTRSMDKAPVRGDYSEIGLTFHFLDEHSLMA